MVFATRAWIPRFDRFTARIARQTGIPIVGGKTALIRREHPPGGDESYQLDVSPDKAVLAASTVDGALHGLETFAQLIAPGPRWIRSRRAFTSKIIRDFRGAG